MSIKHKYIRHIHHKRNTRNTRNTRNITKRHKKYTHRNKRSGLHNLRYIQNNEEHDGREKVTFDTKSRHTYKVNLILSNLENKKYGNAKSNYRYYQKGFH
jgi:hypothetical protein